MQKWDVVRLIKNSRKNMKLKTRKGCGKYLAIMEMA
jgi:hypothetical protein